jgi:hypothetical protein
MTCYNEPLIYHVCIAVGNTRVKMVHRRYVYIPKQRLCSGYNFHARTRPQQDCETNHGFSNKEKQLLPTNLLCGLQEIEMIQLSIPRAHCNWFMNNKLIRLPLYNFHARTRPQQDCETNHGFGNKEKQLIPTNLLPGLQEIKMIQSSIPRAHCNWFINNKLIRLPLTPWQECYYRKTTKYVAKETAVNDTTQGPF